MPMDQKLLNSQLPCTLGALAEFGQKMVDAIKTRDARLDKLTQQLSALQKELAALARREAGK